MTPKSHRRADVLNAVQPPYDLAAPPEGVRLVFGQVATRLKVSISDMANATGISRTAVFNATENRWPVTADVNAIKTALADLLIKAGATDDELATLWHAYTTHPYGGQAHKRIGATAKDADQPAPKDTEMLLPKQTLTPQAKRHFKLFSNPFSGEVATDAAMFMGDDFAYVREALWQCSQTGGFVALVGESGAGKTTVLQDLEARLVREDRALVVIRPSVLGMEGNDTKGKAIKSADILHAIITTLDPQGTVPQTLQARTVRAQKLLTASSQAGAKHLLVVEEAHSMPEATLKHLKRLHEMRVGRSALLGILLVAQPELKAVLASGLYSGTLREVAQRCEIVELLPLDADLKGYLNTRAQAAGVVDLAKLIDDKGVDAIRERLVRRSADRKTATSMCYPLAVNNLMTRALNAAAAAGWPTVTEDVVRAA